MNNISIRQIIIFDAVAQAESYTRAAEFLDLSQSAISQQMKRLEKSIKSPLFERRGNNLGLTSVGFAFHKYSKSIMVQYQNMQAAMGEIKDVHEGSITISAATTANHFISHMLAGFSRHYKNISFTLDITNRESLVKQLTNYVPDFVVMGEPPENMELESEEIMENPLMLVVSPQHPLASATNLTMKDVINEVVVVREKGSGTRAAIRRHFDSNECRFESSFEMGSNEAVKHAVVAGLGLGIVSLHTIKMELESKNLVILDVENMPIRRSWHIVTRKGKHLSPAAKAFHRYIMEHAKEYTDTYRKIATF